MRLLLAGVLDDFSFNVPSKEITAEIGESVEAVFKLIQQPTTEEGLTAFAHVLPVVVDVSCEDLRRGHDVAALENSRTS